MEQTESIASIQLACSHCNETVITPYRNDSGEVFCCQGCQSVYNILQHSNLEQFYEIQKQTGDYTKPVKDLEQGSFDYLASEEYLQKYGSLEKDGTWSMSFYLKGVHCLACLWLIERLPELVSEVSEARLNLGKSLVTVKLKEGQKSFSEAARCLNRLGYPPFPVSNQDEIENIRKKEERGLILKIGVAAFSMMNIMLYTGSVYAGASGSYLLGFGYLSLFLSLPVVFYSALPFYQSAYAALRTKQINIDVPLSVAIITGFFISTYFVFKGSEHFYFDSIATLTFLILLSRLVLKKAQQISLNKNDLLSIFQRGTYLRKQGQDWIEVLSESLKAGEVIKVKPLQTIPCDGKLLSSRAKINMSSLTGESQPVVHIKSNNVFMGTTNMNEDIEIEVLSTGRDTRMGKLLVEIERENYSKSRYSFLTDKISKYFFAGVLVLAAVTFGTTYFQFGLEKALENSLALIIVTCPCALGLATPLTFSRVMELAQSKGIIFKNEESIENLNEIENVFFDKTGTLTTGNFQVIHHTYLGSDHIDYPRAINLLYALESKSQHPIAKSIVNWCSTQNNNLEFIILDLYEEILGKGVKGLLNNRTYEVYSVDDDSDTSKIVLSEDGNPVLVLNLKDALRKESKKLIKTLKKNNFATFILSGDRQHIVNEVSAELGIESDHFKAELTPENKASIISQYPNSLFVGDGANDSLAFNKAKASIATHGSVEMSLRVADIFLSEDNVGLVAEAIKLSKLSIQIVKRNLGFSLVYNISGALLAAIGAIGPLEAAVLMPLSSLTVLGNTLISTRERR